MDLEDQPVVHGDLLVPVKDLKHAAERGAVVNPRRAEAASSCRGARLSQTAISVPPQQ